MTGTYCGQFVMTGYLQIRFNGLARVVITRTVAIGPTLFVALAYRSHDNQLDQLNQALNYMQSIQLPFALIPVGHSYRYVPIS